MGSTRHLRRTDGGRTWTTAPATSCSVVWPRRSDPSRSRTQRGSPSTDRPLPARPRWPTSSPSSCARRVARSSARSIEGFLVARSRRYRRGEYSAEACYHDSFDYDALRRVLLDPLGPGGDRRFQRAVFEYRTDTALSQLVTTTPADAVLLFDGVFLLRRELIDRWDLRIFVSAAFEETLDRARIRDQALFGSATEIEQRHRYRYIPAQQLYFDTARPTDHADIIVHNDDPQQPAWEARTV